MAVILDPAKLDGQQVTGDGATGLLYKTLIAPKQGRRLSANLVTVSPQGVTRRHAHDWEQINYILSGEGVLITGDGVQSPVSGGMIIHVPSGELHWYENTGSTYMTILGILGPDAE